MSLHTCNFVVNAFSSVQFSAVAKAQWKRVCWYNRCIYIHMMHVNIVAWIEFDSVSVFFIHCSGFVNCASIALSSHLVSLFLPPSLFLVLSLSSSLYVFLPSLSYTLAHHYYHLLPHSFFSFNSVYRHDMPQRLPLYDIIGGITWGTISSLRRWCHLGFVAFMWLILVPICICECPLLCTFK